MDTEEVPTMVVEDGSGGATVGGDFVAHADDAATPHLTKMNGQAIVAPTTKKRKSGGDPIMSNRIQKEWLVAVFQKLGVHAFEMGVKGIARKGHHLYGKMTEAWVHANRVTGHNITYSTHRWWFQHYLAFGETKVETKQRMLQRRRKRRGIYMLSQTKFTKQDK